MSTIDISETTQAVAPSSTPPGSTTIPIGRIVRYERHVDIADIDLTTGKGKFLSAATSMIMTQSGKIEAVYKLKQGCEGTATNIRNLYCYMVTRGRWESTSEGQVQFVATGRPEFVGEHDIVGADVTFRQNEEESQVRSGDDRPKPVLLRTPPDFSKAKEEYYM